MGARGPEGSGKASLKTRCERRHVIKWGEAEGRKRKVRPHEEGSGSSRKPEKGTNHKEYFLEDSLI